MSWKRMLFGEKTPDKNDPRYKDRYEKEVEAGRKTARFLKIDKLCAALQRFATNHPKRFLAIVISLMVFCFCYNIYCVVQVCSRPDHSVLATDLQRQRIERRKAKDAELRQNVANKSKSEVASKTQSMEDEVKVSDETEISDDTQSHLLENGNQGNTLIEKMGCEIPSQNDELEPYEGIQRFW